MESFGSYSYSNSRSAGQSSDCGTSTDFAQLSKSISKNIQTMTQNVSQLRSMLSQYGTRSDTPQLHDRVHQLQHNTNQLAKDTNGFIKDMTGLPLPNAPSEQRQQKLQRERLVDELMKCLNNFQQVQRLEKEMEKSTVSRGQQLTSPFVDDELPPSYEKSRTQEIAGGRQQMSLQLDVSDVDYELLREREGAMRQLEADITDVNQIFKDLGMLVHEQGEMIDSIEANVETASVSVEQGTEQLRQASTYQSKARKRKCIIITILLVIVAIIIIVLAVVYGRK